MDLFIQIVKFNVTMKTQFSFASYLPDKAIH